MASVLEKTKKTRRRVFLEVVTTSTRINAMRMCVRRCMEFYVDEGINEDETLVGKRKRILHHATTYIRVFLIERKNPK